MSAAAKRERWTDGKQDRLYEKYFTPLLTASIVAYLEALYEQTQYKLHYLEAYPPTIISHNDGLEWNKVSE